MSVEDQIKAVGKKRGLPDRVVDRLLEDVAETALNNDISKFDSREQDKLIVDPVEVNLRDGLSAMILSTGTYKTKSGKTVRITRPMLEELSTTASSMPPSRIFVGHRTQFLDNIGYLSEFKITPHPDDPDRDTLWSIPLFPVDTAARVDTKLQTSILAAFSEGKRMRASPLIVFETYNFSGKELITSIQLKEWSLIPPSGVILSDDLGKRGTTTMTPVTDSFLMLGEEEKNLKLYDTNTDEIFLSVKSKTFKVIDHSALSAALNPETIDGTIPLVPSKIPAEAVVRRDVEIRSDGEDYVEIRGNRAYIRANSESLDVSPIPFDIAQKIADVNTFYRGRKDQETGTN